MSTRLIFLASPPKCRTLFAALAASIVFAACGGDQPHSPEAPVSIAAPAGPIKAGGEPFKLKLTNVSGAVQWSIDSGSPGTIETDSTGNTRYVPPPKGSISDPMSVNLTAVHNGISYKTSFMLQPSPGLYLVAGQDGGSGTLDGTGQDARFAQPSGIAMDDGGNLYVTDYVSATVRKISPQGAVTTIAGSPFRQGNFDGDALAVAGFYVPRGIAVDPQGNVYVKDYEGLRRIGTDGNVTTPASLSVRSASLVSDHTGNIFTAFDNAIYRTSPAGITTVLAGAANDSAPSSITYGYSDGTGTSARFNGPSDLTVDPEGNLLVADRQNYVIRKITQAGVVSTIAGVPETRGNVDGAATTARFDELTSITADRLGNVFVIDNGKVRRLDASGLVTTLYALDGHGVSASSQEVRDFVADPIGNLYFADAAGNRVVRVSAEGVVSTVAGKAAVSASGTSGQPGFDIGLLARDHSGTLYFTEERKPPINEADRRGLTLWKRTPDGAMTRLADAGTWWGQADPAGRANAFSEPRGMVVDAEGNIFVIDGPVSLSGGGFVYSAGGAALWCITPSGAVSVVAGSPTHSASVDGMGLEARFSNPTDLAIDKQGTFYIADAGRIRRVTADGRVTTLPTQETSITSLDVDANGVIYASNILTGVVLRIGPDGGQAVLAGASGMQGYADGLGAAARFSYPTRVTVSPEGEVFVTDRTNTIRSISMDGRVSTVAGTAWQSGLRLGQLPGNLYAPRDMIAIGNRTLLVSSGLAVVKLVLP